MKIKEEIKELKLKSVVELQKLLALDREKLRDLRFKASQNQLKNVREIRSIKKRIAQILTFMSQKQQAIKK
ncbi:MAG: 50S ribosomal protein L29 [Candidatus Parcubacteria bacterium]|nr:50S ribosomal protein L29 [Candidatus Parcubacteria bacterium]